MRAQKIGVLGGSFNPAHEGHLHISETALRSLGLDQVWWLVSPQNPLKSARDMANYTDRLENARKIAKHPRITISDFEKESGQTYTVNTLQALKRCYPRHQFVWLMGADNLIQIPKWYRWRDIFEEIPVVVFDRPGYSFKALASQAARSYARHRRYPPGAGRPALDFATEKLPAWIFIPYTKHKMSSTYIRNLRESAGKACS